MRFTNNGLTIYLHTDLEMGSVRPSTVQEYYDTVTISGHKFWYPKDTDWYKFALKEFDYALPAPWIVKYEKEYGRHPRGVWCYDKDVVQSPWLGDFVSHQTAMALAIDLILAMWDKRSVRHGGNGG